MESQLVDKLDATPEPNHFDAHMAQLAHDLRLIAHMLECDECLQKSERAQVTEFLKRMQLVSGITIEFPNRAEIRKLKKNVTIH
jgi:hypothetical protein